MSRNEKDEVVDVIVGLAAIAKVVGVSMEGVRYLWAAGRLPVVRLGSAWLANKSALIAARDSDSIRSTRKAKKAPI
jgi:hypothetical protein